MRGKDGHIARAFGERVVRFGFGFGCLIGCYLILLGLVYLLVLGVGVAAGGLERGIGRILGARCKGEGVAS